MHVFYQALQSVSRWMGNSCRPGCFGQRRSVTPISWL